MLRSGKPLPQHALRPECLFQEAAILVIRLFFLAAGDFGRQSHAEVLLMSMEKYFKFLPEEQKGVFTERLGLKRLRESFAAWCPGCG